MRNGSVESMLNVTVVEDGVILRTDTSAVAHGRRDRNAAFGRPFGSR